MINPSNQLLYLSISNLESIKANYNKHPFDYNYLTFYLNSCKHPKILD